MDGYPREIMERLLGRVRGVEERKRWKDNVVSGNGEVEDKEEILERRKYGGGGGWKWMRI